MSDDDPVGRLIDAIAAIRRPSGSTSVVTLMPAP